MKSIFPQPIGTLRDLGTAREWIVDAVCFVMSAVGFIILLMS